MYFGSGPFGQSMCLDLSWGSHLNYFGRFPMVMNNVFTVLK